MNENKQYLEEQKQKLLTKREEHIKNNKGNILNHLSLVEAIDDIIAIIDSELEDEDSSSSIRRV